MHIPVLTKEVIEYLNPKPNENFVDATLGFAGHSKAILEKTLPDGKVLGIEIDPEVCRLVEQEKISRLIVINDSYINLQKIVKQLDFKPVSGVLFDLGFSSWHIENSGRGFSLQKDEPLVMKYKQELSLRGQSPRNLSVTIRKRFFADVQDDNLIADDDLTAGEIVNRWGRGEIEKILKEYGQERFAGRIARVICEARKIKPIKTTFELVEIIKKAIPRKFQYSRIHFATKTFQALRIAVNNELENLKVAIEKAFEILGSKGRLVVISFHSLEDKIVKGFFQNLKTQNLAKILTKKPVFTSLAEVKMNPRARSAKLRALIKN